MQARRQFPLEMDMYSGNELDAHLLSAHPFCEFCNRHFYDTDDIFSHNQYVHYLGDIWVMSCV